VTDAPRLVETFFADMQRGAFSDGLLASDLTVWTTTGGQADPSLYRAIPAAMRRLFPGGLAFTIDSITCQDDRAVAEVRSQGRVDDGSVYANTYVFVFRIRAGRIASVAEHLDPTRVPPALGARILATIRALTDAAS